MLAIWGFAVILGIFTGLYPARRATKIDALDVLRYE
jgi:ABC-type lipoprotein release transport system permease subunit